MTCSLAHLLNLALEPLVHSRKSGTDGRGCNGSIASCSSLYRRCLFCNANAARTTLGLHRRLFDVRSKTSLQSHIYPFHKRILPNRRGDCATNMIYSASTFHQPRHLVVIWSHCRDGRRDTPSFEFVWVLSRPEPQAQDHPESLLAGNRSHMRIGAGKIRTSHMVWTSRPTSHTVHAHFSSTLADSPTPVLA